MIVLTTGQDLPVSGEPSLLLHVFSHHIDHTAYMMQAVEDSPLPFFIEWPSKEEQPDQVLVEHIADPMVRFCMSGSRLLSL